MYSDNKFKLSNKKFELANMVLFNLLAKKSASPPVKIIVKSWFLREYWEIKPSISWQTPLIIPLWIAFSVESPIKKSTSFLSNNGKFAV